MQIFKMKEQDISCPCWCYCICIGFIFKNNAVKYQYSKMIVFHVLNINDEMTRYFLPILHAFWQDLEQYCQGVRQSKEYSPNIVYL